MKDTISQLLNQCLRDFTAITDLQSLVRYETEVSHRRWLDELGRLRVWSGNIGAHQTGQSSLDYRLRDASHLREETTRLLSRLLQIFQDLSEVLNEDDKEALDIEIEDDDESTSMTEVQQLYQNIADTINSLFQISMEIRNPADHDRLLNIRVKDDSFFEPWARQHVSHKYPDADDALISRLGKAMARQKAILKYRERHRAKLGKGLFGDIETTSTKLSETVATEIAPDNDHLQFFETASNSGVSQTSYATSLMETKMAKSIPKPPKASKDKSSFECPYCFHIIVIKHKKDWARHIFRDVMPYVCLSMNCATPSKLYESRHQWFSHMRELHAQGQNGLACPLCHAEIQVLSSFEKHVGRHLEELSLFFLPPTDVDEEASEASPSVLSISGGESVGLPTSDFSHQAPEDPYLSDPSDLEGFGFRRQPHTPSVSSADPPNRLSSLPPTYQNPSSETHGLQVPTLPKSNEEKSNIITYGPQSRVDAIDASDMGENDLSVSSRGSESDARTQSGSGAVKSSRPEDGSGFTVTMNGIIEPTQRKTVICLLMMAKLDPTSAAFGEPAGNSFQEINLDDSTPQLDLSFEPTKRTSGGGVYGFGGWGKDWNTGGKWGFGPMGNDTSATKEPPVKESPWGLGDKNTKKAAGSLGFDLGDLGTSTADIGTSKEVKDDDIWGSFAAVNKNKKKKKKDSITETDLGTSTADISTSKEVKDDDIWGSFAAVGKNGKKKKDSITETDSNVAGLDIERRRPEK
ncbi:hypothetical protein EIK77_004409 [Talaromyces pinophilus]|nr:hypothetical protein EIK77_004409 [Talaromyces pinophilus]